MTSVATQLPEGYKPGLEGVVAGASAIAEVDSIKDALTYRGYAAHELAEKSNYEEVCFLLLTGKLPTKTELSQFKSELEKERAIPASVVNQLKALPPKFNVMNALRIGVCLLGEAEKDVDQNDPATNFRKAKTLIAKTATLVAALSRIRSGQDPIAPHPTLGTAANFLYMMTGKVPDPEVAKVLDSTLILYSEHGFNASTFAALVTASTLSDMHSSVASAIGALKGPLHGGANEAAIHMLLAIGDASNVGPWLKATFARKEKVMGFGHRVYKLQDSRAPYMKVIADKMSQRVGDKKLFPLSTALAEAVKKEKGLFPNVDYHCAVVYYLMGLPIDIYTAMFAMARMAGWVAHVSEQHAANRLIRPECFYSGPRDLPYVPLEER